MTTANVEVAQSIPPGTIIFVRPTRGCGNPGSLDEGVFGFTCSLDYWNRKASERASQLRSCLSNVHPNTVNRFLFSRWMGILTGSLGLLKRIELSSTQAFSFPGNLF